MKIWLDDLRPAPQGYKLCHSVNEAIDTIKTFISNGFWDDDIDIIDCDHDLGQYSIDGGDGIKLLDWIEKENLSFPIRIHTMNPVGRENMRAIIKRNNWKEVF